MSVRSKDAVVSTVFTCAAVALFVAFCSDSRDDLPTAVQWLIFCAPFVGYGLVGFVIGKWWVLLLAFLPVLLTIPLGGCQSDHDHAPIWQFALSYTVVYAIASAMGWAVRVSGDRRRKAAQ